MIIQRCVALTNLIVLFNILFSIHKSYNGRISKHTLKCGVAVLPKRPVGRSAAQRSASMEARTVPRRSSKSLIRVAQQNAKFAHSAAAPDAAPNEAACERSAAFISEKNARLVTQNLGKNGSAPPKRLGR